MNSVEIAKLAGVSRSTVSRVINNYPNVPEETKLKVMEVINKYNYVPHASARMLAGKHNKILGLIIIDTKKGNEKVYSNTYFSPITSTIIDYAKNYGYNVLVSIVSENSDFRHVKDIFYNKTISGGIFVGCNNNDENIAEIINNGQYTAIIGQDEKVSEHYTKSLIVNPDNYKGAYEATKCLISQGHNEIIHICGDLNQLSAIERLNGYKSALSDSNLPIKKNLIINGNFTEESGYKATLKLIAKNLPTAIFAANDQMAIGCIQALHDNNISVPEQVSVIGFDDIEVAKYIKPSLSTVKIPLTQIAAIIVSNLINSIESSSPICGNYRIPLELIVRDSIKK